MKKYIYLVAIIATISLNAMAQKGERLEAMKIGFITERLNLSSDEAKVFWPVYNKFTDDLKNCALAQKEK